MTATKVSLKLLIDKKSHRVLFAEADNKFVDFLFSILTLPVGTVTMLLQEEKMAGCLHSLYDSVDNLSDDIYIRPDRDIDFLLDPKVAISGAKAPAFLPGVKQSYAAVTAGKFYKCGNNMFCSGAAVANDQRAICPSCKNTMNYELRYVEYPPRDIKASSSEGGYVKGLITYMVMDDLEVKPMSAISAITLLSKFNVRDIGAVEEKVVDFGMDEVLQSSLSFCALQPSNASFCASCFFFW